jgi:hypothetical protein
MDPEGWLRDERRMIERGEWTSPQKRVAEVQAQHITLAEYADTWIRERNIKPRTRNGYEALWDNHIQTLGKVPLVPRVLGVGHGCHNQRGGAQSIGPLSGPDP